MDEEKKEELEEIEEEIPESNDEEISYKYMGMTTSSDYEEIPQQQNSIFSIKKDNNDNYNGFNYGGRKKSKLSLFLIIVILVLSLVYGTYYFKNKLSNNNTEEKQEEKKEETDNKPTPAELKNEKDPEEEVTDQQLIDILNKKLETLDVTPDDRRTVLFDKTRKLDDFSEIDLMIVALYNVKPTNLGKGYDYCYDLETQKLEYKPSNCSYGMIAGYVDAKDLEMFYRSMFGIPLNKKDKYTTCPSMLYNKDKDIYYLSYSCGGAGFPTNLTYIYKYTTDVNAAYIYVAYGVMGGDGTIFTDYAMKNKYKDSDYDFKITQANYGEFSKYRLVFNKKDNDLNFAYIEKLEQ